MASSGANAWVPEQRQLELTLEVLRASQSSSTATQQVVQRTLADYNQNPQFNRYLLFVLTQLRHEAEHTRSMAGICLKNNVRAMYSSIPQDVIHDVRVTCLLCLGESSELLRATIGMLITTIAVRGGLSEWPGLLQTLIEQMGNADITVGLVKLEILPCFGYVLRFFESCSFLFDVPTVTNVLLCLPGSNRCIT